MTTFVVTALMFAFTDLTDDSYFKNIVGYIVLSIIFLNIAVSFILVIK
jgi:hypothetical protein